MEFIWEMKIWGRADPTGPRLLHVGAAAWHQRDTGICQSGVDGGNRRFLLKKQEISVKVENFYPLEKRPRPFAKGPSVCTWMDHDSVRVSLLQTLKLLPQKRQVGEATVGKLSSKTSHLFSF